MLHGWALVFGVLVPQRYPQNRLWDGIGISGACMYSNVRRGCRYADVITVIFVKTNSTLALFTAAHFESVLSELKVTQHVSRPNLDDDSACYL